MPTSRTLRLLTRWAPLLLTWAAQVLAGCGDPLQAWGPFEEIEVGKPLPADLPAGTVRGKLGVSLLAVSDPTQAPGAKAEGLAIRILTDDAGRIVAKSQLSATLQGGLFYRWRYRYVFECEAPQTVRPPAGDWKPRREMTTTLAMCSALSFSASEKGEEDCPADTAHLRNGTNRLLSDVRDLWAKSDELVKKNEARIMALEANAVLEVAVANFVAMWRAYEPNTIRRHMTAEDAMDYPLDNAVEQAMYWQVLLSLGSPPLKCQKECDAYLIVKVGGQLFPKIAELLADPSKLRGMERPGFAWETGALLGPEFTIRNVDGRRIRIELADSFTTSTSSGHP